MTDDLTSVVIRLGEHHDDDVGIDLFIESASSRPLRRLFGRLRAGKPLFAHVMGVAVSMFTTTVK